MERTAWLLAVVAAMVTAEGGGNELPGWSDKFVREIIGSDGYVVVFFSWHPSTTELPILHCPHLAPCWVRSA